MNDWKLCLGLFLPPSEYNVDHRPVVLHRPQSRPSSFTEWNSALWGTAAVSKFCWSTVRGRRLLDTFQEAQRSERRIFGVGGPEIAQAWGQSSRSTFFSSHWAREWVTLSNERLGGGGGKVEKNGQITKKLAREKINNPAIETEAFLRQGQKKIFM